MMPDNNYRLELAEFSKESNCVANSASEDLNDFPSRFLAGLSKLNGKPQIEIRFTMFLVTRR